MSSSRSGAGRLFALARRASFTKVSVSTCIATGKRGGDASIQEYPISRVRSGFRAKAPSFRPWCVISFDDDRLAELGIDDELRDRRITANVALGRCVKHLRIEFADNVAQVEIAVDDLGDVEPAHFAEISLVAFGHDDSLAAPSPQTSVHGAKSGELR